MFLVTSGIIGEMVIYRLFWLPFESQYIRFHDNNFDAFGCNAEDTDKDGNLCQYNQTVEPEPEAKPTELNW